MSRSDDFPPAARAPLKPAAFHILLALAREGLHGYGIMQAVRTQSDGRVRLSTGALYRHLQQIIDDGLVAESARRPANDDPRRGTYYRLTPQGRRALAAESGRLAAIVSLTEELGIIPERAT